MKKIFMVITLIVININTLLAFDGFIPATEMKGRNIRFNTYYQKSYSNFDEGIHDIGAFLSLSGIYKGLVFGLDGNQFGDNIYKKLRINLHTGYRFSSFSTLVFSYGMMNYNVSKDLIFPEEYENLSKYNKTVYLIGVSANFNLNYRLNVGFGIYNLNQPNISLLNQNEKLHTKLFANVDLMLTRGIHIGGFYLKENEKDYFGAKFGFNIPTGVSQLAVKSEFTSEKKVSTFADINHITYWELKARYDHYFNEDLNGTNYFISFSKEFPNKEMPEIEFKDPRWNKASLSSSSRIINLDFKVKNLERIKEVKVKLNGKEQYNDHDKWENIWEFDYKNYSLYLELNEGDNEIDIKVTGINGKTFEKNLILTYREPKKDIEEIDIFDDISIIVDVDINIPEAGQENKDAVAVVIGNRDYEFYPDNPVEFALNDRNLVERYAKKLFGYKKVIGGENLGFAKFRNIFGTEDDPEKKLFRTLRINEPVFIYLTGHGHSKPQLNQKAKSYIVPKDGNSNDLDATCYPLDVLYQNLSYLIEKKKPEKLILITDMCFSGYLTTAISSARWESENPLQDLMDIGRKVGTDVVCIFATQETQTAKWYQSKKHGLLTYFVLKAFHNSENEGGYRADINNDKKLTVGELKDFVLDENYGVPYFANQREIVGDSDLGQLPVIIGDDEIILLEYK